MKNLMVLFFVLFVSVAGFAVEGVCDNGFGVDNACLETEYGGGELDMVQTMCQISIMVTENENNFGNVIVVNDFGKVVFSESFEGDALVIMDKMALNSGGYTLVAKAGTTKQMLRFVIKE